MPFASGDLVHVAAVGKGVVRDVRNGGRYLVDVKGRAMVVAGSALTAIEARARRRAPVPAPTTTERVRDAAGTPASIDLHGKTVEEAVAVLDEFLNDALLAGLAEVRVIHGRSGGRVKAAVHARLELIGAVRAFRVDATNAGVTIVSL